MSSPNDANALEEIFRAKRVALVVYDMQVGIIHQLPHAGPVVEKVSELLTAARAVGMPVFFTRHLSLPRRLMGRFAVRQAMLWQRTDDPDKVVPWFLPDAPVTALIPECTPRPDEAVIDKYGMSAFEGTYLATAIRDLGLDSFLVAGIATEIGIEPTIRQASDLGLLSILVADACGAGHAEAGERAVESIRFMGDAIVTDLSTVISALNNG